jgi:hypothetical protein
LKKGRNFSGWPPPYFVKWREICRPLKICSFEVNSLAKGGEQPIFTRCSFPKKYLQDQRKHTCSTTKISMAVGSKI